MKKTLFPIWILILCLLLSSSVFASGTETAATPRIEASHRLQELPAHWNPLKDLTAEGELLLRLTGDTLYARSSDGQELIPSLAVSLPVDVTEEFAGQYGIAPGTNRGYAFEIEIDPNAKWEDGNALNGDDFLFTINLMIDTKRLPVELANLENYYSGAEKTTGTVVSLRDAGFSSVEEAQDLGHSLFYVDTAHFWGLDNGWVSCQDHTRLKDAAIPSGVTEMYVSGAYLYDRYLRTGSETDVFQTEFVGISAQPQYVERGDIGLIRRTENRFVLILSHPTTAEALALSLSGIVPMRESIYAENYATSVKTYRSSGPYRIISISGGIVTLEPNPYWLGKTEAFRADVIRLETEIGA